AALIHPACQLVMPGTKSVVRWSMSVVITISRSPQGTTAQSSAQLSFPTILITTCKSSRSSTFPHLLTAFALVLLEDVLDHLGLFLPLDLHLLVIPAGKGVIKDHFPAEPLPVSNLNSGLPA